MLSKGWSLFDYLLMLIFDLISIVDEGVICFSFLNRRDANNMGKEQSHWSVKL